MTEKEMKKWAIEKWEWIVNNWDYSKDFGYNMLNLENDIPELEEFTAHCSYCEKYFYNNAGGECHGCPLDEDNCFVCCDEFEEWDNEPIKENAEKMLNKIKNIEVK